MPDVVIEFLKQVNIIQLIAIGIMVWFFYNRLDSKIDKLRGELKGDIDKSKGELGDRIDKLADKVEDIDRRLCRIEGSLSTHGHCLFNQTRPEQKAE